MCDRRDQGVRICVHVNEQPASPEIHLLKGMIDGRSGTRNDVLIIDIADDSDNPARGGTDIDELDHGIGPHHVMVYRILVRKHSLGYALAYDHYRFAAAAVGIVEIASRNQGNTKSREKSRRNGTEARTRVFFTPRPDVTVGRELEAEIEIVIPPGDVRANRHTIHPR